jgi:hypothetical protein
MNHNSVKEQITGVNRLWRQTHNREINQNKRKKTKIPTVSVQSRNTIATIESIF